MAIYGRGSLVIFPLNFPTRSHHIPISVLEFSNKIIKRKKLEIDKIIHKSNSITKQRPFEGLWETQIQNTNKKKERKKENAEKKTRRGFDRLTSGKESSQSKETEEEEGASKEEEIGSTTSWSSRRAKEAQNFDVPRVSLGWAKETSS